MTDQEENRDPQESTKVRGGQARGEQKKTAPRFSGHPPIIITDSALRADTPDPDDAPASTTTNDILVEFDAGDESAQHYQADGSGLVFTGNGLKTIRFVRVKNNEGEHRCPGVPTNCLIRVTEKKRDTSTEREIVIDARSGTKIVIKFPDDYLNQTAGDRKKMRGGLKKLKRLRIFDVNGKLLHDCPEVKKPKDCVIAICDDCHI
jgi:hypothetical protein